MTSIKPPTLGPQGPQSPQSSQSSLDPSQLSEPATPSTAESNATGPFANALDSAKAAASRQTGETPASGEIAAQHARDPIANLARDIEAGRLGMDQAVDQLVEQALEHVGKHLSNEQRAELSGLLRDAMANDPTLRALSDERS